MKILYCSYRLPDCGLDTLYEGLCDVLGEENVLDYPHKPSYHGEGSNSFKWYPIFSKHPTFKTDVEKLEMLKNKEFDAVFVGCRNKSGFWDHKSRQSQLIPNPVSQPIIEASKITPTFLIDQADEEGINEELAKIFNAKLYFKREYIKGEVYPSMVFPLNFSYSERRIPVTIDNPRPNFIFWAGKDNYASRTKYLEPIEKIRGEKFSGHISQKVYAHLLLSSKIGLNLRGFGYDTMRYWEIPAHATMLFSEKLKIQIDNDFVDGKTAVFFENPEEMQEKLKFCLANPDYVDKIRLAGFEWFKKYHTSRIRAGQLVDKIKKYV
jgi:hypothetical protein